MTFKTVGVLPVAAGRWHVRMGGGHIWFVNEDPDEQPYCLQECGLFVSVFDVADEPDIPLIQPRVDA